MKQFITVIILTVLLVLSCGKNYNGTYVGYSWKGEAKGVSLEDATEKIETTLTLDKKGVITDAKMLFYIKAKDGSWYTRQTTTADIGVDFSVNPSPATAPVEGTPYAPGKSMFTIKVADPMSLWAVAVDANGTVAFTLVEPITRYRFESKLPASFDFSTKIKDMTIGNGLIVPTVRTSAGGYIQVNNWENFANNNILSFYKDPHVITGRGTFSGISAESTIREMLSKAGVVFDGNVPQPKEVTYGFFGLGGWEGNYKAISNFLKGKNATKLTSLIDWKNPRYAPSIDENNFFGLNAVSGATRTVQNSVDGIAGATVRMSRESTSYQRALVAAGILQEKDVVKGRF